MIRRTTLLGILAAGCVLLALPSMAGAAPPAQAPVFDLTIQTSTSSSCAGWTFDVDVTFNTPIRPGSAQWSGPLPQSGTWILPIPPQDHVDIYLTLSAQLMDGTPVSTEVYGNVWSPGSCPGGLSSWGWTTWSTDWTRLDAGTGACSMEPRYYMYTLEDENQPAGWAPYCYILSSDGVPSVESQARVCTVPGSDHTFQATSIPYGGWVYADCNGNASYGWPAWDPAWYRGHSGLP